MVFLPCMLCSMIGASCMSSVCMSPTGALSTITRSPRPFVLLETLSVVRTFLFISICQDSTNLFLCLCCLIDVFYPHLHSGQFLMSLLEKTTQEVLLVVVVVIFASFFVRSLFFIVVFPLSFVFLHSFFCWCFYLPNLSQPGKPTLCANCWLAVSIKISSVEFAFELKALLCQLVFEEHPSRHPPSGCAAGSGPSASSKTQNGPLWSAVFDRSGSLLMEPDVETWALGNGHLCSLGVFSPLIRTTSLIEQPRMLFAVCCCLCLSKKRFWRKRKPLATAPSSRCSMIWAACSMAKSSSAERTTLVSRILVKTCVFKQKTGCGAWIRCHESVLCVGVNCANICCFVTHYRMRVIFHQKGPTLMSFMLISGSSPGNSFHACSTVRKEGL